MTNDAEVYMQKIKARNFVQNNGQILRTINIAMTSRINGRKTC